MSKCDINMNIANFQRESLHYYSQTGYNQLQVPVSQDHAFEYTLPTKMKNDNIDTNKKQILKRTSKEGKEEV